MNAAEIEVGADNRFVVIGEHSNFPGDDGLAVGAFDAGGDPETPTVSVATPGGGNANPVASDASGGGKSW